ncbi:helix-turn-helix domain-containing protein [Nocardioides limicola]|uniref:helix-turn-helix domain-containing protein n=1 Tax=Nocardioides limicola TaxID=2803368 RepID=UPI00193BBE12|nr:helix-turn-helix domain-containing protein [Nocardioides sp. DJM-14]
MSDRDRLRQLLDAALDEDNRTLGEMADGAHSSPYHFSRLLSGATGEAPVAMRRRLMLERAAWQLGNGSSVTEAAWAAGYESVEGFSRAFSRAFGHPPSSPGAGHWLPAPNGIHFHPPMSLWVHSTEQAMNPLTEQLVGHDLGDTRYLLDLAKAVDPAEFHRVRMPGLVVLAWDGPEESLAQVLSHHVRTREVWLAAINGDAMPPQPEHVEAVDLWERHEATAPRWLAMVRDLERRGAWDDRLIDARCEPPESFQLAHVLTHVLAFSAHRRLLARHLFRAAGVETDDGDPIGWLRSLRGEADGEEH